MLALLLAGVPAPCHGMPAIRGDASLGKFELQRTIQERLQSAAVGFNSGGGDGGAAAANVTRDVAALLDELLDAPRRIKESFTSASELSMRSVAEVFGIARAARQKLCQRGMLAQALRKINVHLDALPPKLCYPITRRLVSALVVKHVASCGDGGGGSGGGRGGVSSGARRAGGGGGGGNSDRRGGGGGRGALDQRTQALILGTARKLLTLHRRAAVEKGIIEFFHVSKSGGTSLCQLAKDNGCRTRDFGTVGNCLIREFDDGPRWVARAAHKPRQAEPGRPPWFVRYEEKRQSMQCAVRRRYMRAHNYNFYANEYALHGGHATHEAVHLCAEFLNVLMFR